MEARGFDPVRAWVEYRSGAALLYNPFRRTGLILSYVLQHRGGRSMNATDSVALYAKFIGEFAPAASTYGGQGGFTYKF